MSSGPRLCACPLLTQGTSLMNIPLLHIHVPLLTHVFCTFYFPHMSQGLEQHRGSTAGHVGETLCQESLYVPLDFFGRNKTFFLSKKLTAFKQKEIGICSTNSLETLAFPYFKKQDLVLLEIKPVGQGLKLVGLSSLKSRSSFRYSLPSRNQWPYVRVH